MYRTEPIDVQADGMGALSSLLGSLRAPPRQTSRHLRLPGGLLGEEPSSFFTVDTLMPTFSAMCSNFTLAGELPLPGLSFFFESLLGLSLDGSEGDIGGETNCGEFGGLVMPSSEPSLKRL